LVLGTAAGAAGQDGAVRAGDLVIEGVWARATPGSAMTGAAYMTLSNQGSEPDQLVTAATPAAERAELHTHLAEDGVMKMRPVDAIEVAPGERTVLAPGGLHVMLFDLKVPLKEGDRFPLTLTFQKAGTATVEVAVQPLGASGPGHGGAAHQDHEHQDHEHQDHEHQDHEHQDHEHQGHEHQDHGHQRHD